MLRYKFHVGIYWTIYHRQQEESKSEKKNQNKKKATSYNVQFSTEDEFWFSFL